MKKSYQSFSKCVLFCLKTELVYLGFLISQGLKMDKDKIKAIIEWPTPKNIFAVRSFHGLTNFYRRFIRNFSGIYTAIVDTIQVD